MPDALSGRCIILAGGSGGLGSATAASLGKRGAQIVVSYCSNAERARKLAPVATIVQADITKAEDRARLLDAARDLYGLVVFTGDPARVAPGDSAEDAMLRSHAVNYMGPLLLAREAAERLRATKTAGAIVLISTMQAVALFAGSAIYGAPKAALIHGGRILAKECRGAFNIRVNIIAPGVMDAGMAQASIATGKYNRYLDDGTISRFGRAEDIARAVEFLLEPDSYITGQVLSVDGGITL